MNFRYRPRLIKRVTESHVAIVEFAAYSSYVDCWRSSRSRTRGKIQRLAVVSIRKFVFVHQCITKRRQVLKVASLANISDCPRSFTFAAAVAVNMKRIQESFRFLLLVPTKMAF